MRRRLRGRHPAGRALPDAAPTLRQWQAAGLHLSVRPSGSVDAQKLLFGHSDAGPLVPLFRDFFDTRIGGKRDADSYRAIAKALGCVPASLLFLSDVEAELTAAATAGLAVCQLVRLTDGTVASSRFPTGATLAEAGLLLGLPAGANPAVP